MDQLICSAKGCRAGAVWALAWNNPKLHEPSRRKTWLACDAHRETLGEFLAARGFLRETTALATEQDAQPAGDMQAQAVRSQSRPESSA